ncbi:MAG: dihydrofolate reductase [Ignavibacteria bacterium]|nr:dihydrofolate reductase [Ignavibacteria bacterium]
MIISAKSKNGVIGRQGELPWHSKDEFLHFKTTTFGSPIIMGRKTFQSLGKPLKGRLHLVITRQKNFSLSFREVLILNDLETAFAYCEKNNFEKVYVIGGGEIYKQAINYADELIISIMNIEVEGDVFFPAIDPSLWKEISREKRNEFDIVVYSKI